MATTLPKGIRRFIRDEKARIRHTTADQKEQQKLIIQLKEKLNKPVKSAE